MPIAPRCPTCRKPVTWEGNPHRPFCSERCRTLDLGNWAAERYRIAGEEAPAEDQPTTEVKANACSHKSERVASPVSAATGNERGGARGEREKIGT